MLYLSRGKLDSILRAKGLNIAKLAKACGVSRQSIYNMFGKTAVFNTTFEKILSCLGVGYDEISEKLDRTAVVTKNFPDRIKKISLKLISFAEKRRADLILFGSRASGKTGIRHDFDFAIYFHKKPDEKGLSLLRQRLSDDAFPYRIDIINLNTAPEWFKSSIKEDMIYLRREEK